MSAKSALGVCLLCLLVSLWAVSVSVNLSVTVICQSFLDLQIFWQSFAIEASQEASFSASQGAITRRETLAEVREHSPNQCSRGSQTVRFLLCSEPNPHCSKAEHQFCCQQMAFCSKLNILCQQSPRDLRWVVQQCSDSGVSDHDQALQELGRKRWGA